VVTIESDAESVTVDEEVAAGLFGRAVVAHGAARDLQCIADPSVDGAQFGAPGDEPGRVALSHATTKGTMRAS
jgi:hypothetical protein